MKQKINFLLITMLFALCLSACGKQSADQTDVTADRETLSEAEGPETEDTAPEQAAAESAEGFDMERICKSIIIKGQPFEVPVALCDLGEGWTWEEHELSFYAPEGEGVVTIYYNGEEWYDVVVNNYYEGNEEQGTVCNIAIETSDCSIDGLIPGETTKQEVVERYGEPTEVIEDWVEDGYVYRYIVNDNETQPIRPEKMVGIGFDKNNVAIEITITYK